MCAGAVVNARDHRKRTPLHVAAEEGHKELIEFLLSKKADATIADLNGNTPVDLAAKKQHKNDAVEILVEHSKSLKRDNPVKRVLKKAFGKGEGQDQPTDGVTAKRFKTMTPFGYALRLHK